MAKARVEETDRRTAKDVVENGERLETPVPLNFLTSGVSTYWVLTALSLQAFGLHSTLPCAVRLEVLVFTLFPLPRDWPEKSSCASLVSGVWVRGACLVLFWLQDISTDRHLPELDVVAVSRG